MLFVSLTCVVEVVQRHMCCCDFEYNMCPLIGVMTAVLNELDISSL